MCIRPVNREWVTWQATRLVDVNPSRIPLQRGTYVHHSWLIIRSSWSAAGVQAWSHTLTVRNWSLRLPDENACISTAIHSRWSAHCASIVLITDSALRGTDCVMHATQASEGC